VPVPLDGPYSVEPEYVALTVSFSPTGAFAARHDAADWALEIPDNVPLHNCVVPMENATDPSGVTNPKPPTSAVYVTDPPSATDFGFRIGKVDDVPSATFWVRGAEAEPVKLVSPE
jgi:hypothetical protein